MKRKQRILLLLCLLLALTPMVSAEGNQATDAAMARLHSEVPNAALSMNVDIGYGNAITYGKYIPATVVITNTGADFNGSLCLNLYQNYIEYDRVEVPLEVASGASKRVVLPIKPQRKQAVFTFELVENGKVVYAKNAQPSETISPYAMMVGVLSNAPETLNYMTITQDNDELLRGESWKTVPLDADSFPSDAQMMNSFGMVVVNGFDVNTLSDAQKAAFEQWLKDGGIVIVGGGAQAQTDYPWFAQWTGLDAGELAQAEDITPAIMRYVSMTGESVNDGFLLNVPGANRAALIAGESPLVYESEAEAGVIYSATFDLGAKPITLWRSVGTMWQRILLTSEPTLYSIALNAGRNEGGSANLYRVQSAINSMNIANEESAIAPTVALIVFLAAGLAAYFVLKKLDRRELLWVVMPVLSIAAAGAIYLMSLNSTLNRPMAATVTHLSNGVNQSGANVYVGFAAKDVNRQTLSTPDGDLTITTDSYYYDDSDDERSSVPTKLRYCYRYGAQKEIEFESTAAWTVRYASIADVNADWGAVKGQIWMEEDGLHATIENATAYPLKDGYLLTGLGYCRVPEILPGQSVDAAILEWKDGEEKPIGRSYGYSAVDGKLIYRAAAASTGSLLSSSSSSYQGRMEIYDLINMAVYPEQVAMENWDSSRLPSSENSARESLSDLLLLGLDSSDSSASYYAVYAGFNDELGRVELTMNGKPIERVAHKAIISADMEYLPVGKTGVVYYAPGVLDALPVEADESGKPHISGSAEQKFYDDSTMKMMAFRIPDARKITLESMAFSANYIEGNATAYLYNAKTGEWDEQKSLYVNVAENAADYVNADGEVYVRVQSRDMRGGYLYVDRPYLEVKGRTK
ncbi:MAG: hypothetical protein Q4E18_02935 [Clostridia bacterium]|nr:hypothetical protein [Clostridia bacterium]